MAISVEDYVSAVRAQVPEARELADRLAAEHDEIRLVWQLNSDLMHLLVWSWRSGDLDTCARVLGVMEMGLVDTAEDHDAPVWNSVGIGVIEDIHHRLRRDDYAAFVATWPSALRAQGLLMAADDDEFDEQVPDFSLPPLRVRIRWVLRHPLRTRLGTRITYAG